MCIFDLTKYRQTARQSGCTRISMSFYYSTTQPVLDTLTLFNSCPFDGGKWCLNFSLICIPPIISEARHIFMLIDYVSTSLSYLSISFCPFFFYWIVDLFFMLIYIAGFLNSVTIDILDGMILSRRRLFHDCKIFISIPGLFSMDASSKSPQSQLWQACLQALPNHPQLRANCL